jgi:PAS domain S-box-containing protein
VAAAADRTQAEEALRESELRYRTLAETSGVGIWQVTPDGATIYANPAMCAFLGCDTMEEVQRRSYDSFFTRESLRRMRREHIRRSQGIASSYEVEVERADGETRTAVAYGAPIQNPDGTLHSRIGTFVDVTERKKAEEALQESDLRFRQLTENINEVFWLMDAETRRIIYLSPAVERIWGITAEQNLRRPGLWLDYVHPGDRDRVRRLTRGLPNHDFADEFRIVRSDGTIRWLRNRAFPVRNPEGVVFRFAGIVEDITERKEFETHLQHSQKLESLGILAGGIAHDFNNLLLGILGNADLALMEIGPVSPGRRYLEDAVKICQRAADLCNQMLAYSGRGKFVIETVDIGLLVREMSHLLEVSVSKKAVLKYNFADNLSPMEGDATQIRQVIMNLITNASDALGTSSGVITVSTGSLHCDHLYLRETYLVDKLPEGEYVYFEVSDNGAGMSRETRTRIFDPFFTTKFTGRGLGLAAVLGIVRSHKGAIKVYSEVGHGSTFKVLFPVSNHEYDRQRSPERAEALPAGRGTILLVDDEEAIRIVGQKTLEKAGYTVVTASNGAEAIEVVRALGETIEAVVLDMTMPKMGGEEAFREMRRIRPGIRVLLSSGYSEGDATQRFSGKGLAGFLQKPYRPHALIQSLSNILAQHE